MDVPENVGLNHIQASIFSLLYQILPHLHAQPIPQENHKQAQNTFQPNHTQTEKCEDWYTSGVLLG